jgi:exodeoxyribonuclease V alpha subunit
VVGKVSTQLIIRPFLEKITQVIIHGEVEDLPSSLTNRTQGMINQEFLTIPIAMLKSIIEQKKVGHVDQLAPVEAGAPLASIVRHFEKPEQPDPVAKLSTNRRFGSDSTIHSLCQAIAKGDEERAKELIGQGPKEDFEHSEKGLSEEADEIIRRGYAPLAEAKTPEEAHEAFLGFQILCPTHEGETGVNPTNERVQKILGITKRDKDQSGRYAGMPIIIEKNDYGVELYNGDIGFFLPEQENPEQLTAWFMKSNGTFRSVSPTRLPSHSAAYAMTVHRSQGSEYEDVMVLLPSKHSEILTRHLLYVACSRAKKKVRLFGPSEIIEETVKQDTLPSFGMEHRLQNS